MRAGSAVLLVEAFATGSVAWRRLNAGSLRIGSPLKSRVLDVLPAAMAGLIAVVAKATPSRGFKGLTFPVRPFDPVGEPEPSAPLSRMLAPDSFSRTVSFPYWTITS